MRNSSELVLQDHVENWYKSTRTLEVEFDIESFIWTPCYFRAITNSNKRPYILNKRLARMRRAVHLTRFNPHLSRFKPHLEKSNGVNEKSNGVNEKSNGALVQNLCTNSRTAAPTGRRQTNCRNNCCHCGLFCLLPSSSSTIIRPQASEAREKTLVPSLLVNGGKRFFLYVPSSPSSSQFNHTADQTTNKVKKKW